MLSKMDYGRHFKVISHWQKLPARYQTIRAKLLRLFCSICGYLHISAYQIVSRFFEAFLPDTEMTRLDILQMILNYESNNYNYLNDPFNVWQYHMTISVEENVMVEKELHFISEDKLPTLIWAEANSLWERECLTTERLYVTIQDIRTCEFIKLRFDYKSYGDEILKSLDEEWPDNMAEHSGEPPYAPNGIYAYSEVV